jgi:hypothetical protein
MLLVCIIVDIKSVFRYRFLILITSHPGTIYVSKGFEGPWLSSKPKGGTRAKKFGTHCSGVIIFTNESVEGLATDRLV